MSFARDVSEDEVYVIKGEAKAPEPCPEGFVARLCALELLEAEHWKRVEALTGRFSAAYLRWSYRTPGTALLLITREDRLAGVLWVVPGATIKRRYPFVRGDSAAIIACVTHPSFRGLGLYPAGICAIAASGHSPDYFIWAHKNNQASLRGILKAGGRKVGEFTRVRWFRGLISRVYFRPEKTS